MTLKLFVWEGVLYNQSSGMVCVLAENIEDAFELLYRKDGIAWSRIQGIWNELTWEHDAIIELAKKHPKEDLTQLQKRYLKIKVSPKALRPKIVTKPKAFVVHGGF